VSHLQSFTFLLAQVARWVVTGDSAGTDATAATACATRRMARAAATLATLEEIAKKVFRLFVVVAARLF